MSDLKQDLIKLGSEEPDLRPNIRPVLDRISSEFSGPYEGRQDYNDFGDKADHLTLTVFEQMEGKIDFSYLEQIDDTDRLLKEREDLVGEFQRKAEDVVKSSLWDLGFDDVEVEKFDRENTEELPSIAPRTDTRDEFEESRLFSNEFQEDGREMVFSAHHGTFVYYPRRSSDYDKKWMGVDCFASFTVEYRGGYVNDTKFGVTCYGEM